MNTHLAVSKIPMRLSDELGRPLVGGRVFPLESHVEIPAEGLFEVIRQSKETAWILVEFQGRYGVVLRNALHLAAERIE